MLSTDEMHPLFRGYSNRFAAIIHTHQYERPLIRKPLADPKPPTTTTKPQRSRRRTLYSLFPFDSHLVLLDRRLESSQFSSQSTDAYK